MSNGIRYSDKEQSYSVVNVLQYGAFGNGTTNDTTAIQNAINAASTLGLPVYLPAGIYKCSTWSSFDITGDVKIFSDHATIIFQSGTDATLKINANVEIVNCILDFSGAQYGIEYPSTANLKSLEITGSTLQNADRLINGLGSPSGDHLYINNCNFTNCSYAIGEHNQKNIKHIAIQHNRFTNLDERGKSTQVNAVALGGIWSSLDEFYNQSCIVSDNVFINIDNTNASEAHAIINYLPYAIILSNYIYNISASGSDGGEAIYNKGYAAEIINNYIHNGCVGGEGVIAVKGGDHCTVMGNTLVFDNNPSSVNGIYVQSDHNLISSNKVVGINGARLNAAISIAGGFEEEIINNSIYGFNVTAGIGIGLSQSTSCSIRNNTIKDCSPGTSGGVFAAIKITAPTKLTSVSCDPTTDIITKASHGITEGIPVVVTGTVVPSGLSSSSKYYAYNVTNDTLKLNAQPNGSGVDITSSGTSVNIQVLCDNIIIDGNILKRLGPSSRGVYINRTGLMRDIYITNNIFEGVVGSSIYMDLSGGDDEPNGIFIENNAFQNVTSNSAYALAAMELGNCKRLYINNNSVRDYTGQNGSYNTAGILLVHNVAGENDITDIIGNEFVNITNTASVTRGRPINISTSSGTIQSLNIIDNDFTNSYYGINQSTNINPIKWTLKDNVFSGITDVINGTWVHSNVYTFINNEVSGTFPSEINVNSLSVLTASDTTPSVNNADSAKTNNSSTTTITNFDDGYDGQQFTLRVDANTTIQNNANIKLNNSVNYTPPSGGMITFLRDGSVWYEVSRTTF